MQFTLTANFGTGRGGTVAVGPREASGVVRAVWDAVVAAGYEPTPWGDAHTPDVEIFIVPMNRPLGDPLTQGLGSFIIQVTCPPEWLLVSPGPQHSEEFADLRVIQGNREAPGDHSLNISFSTLESLPDAVVAFMTGAVAPRDAPDMLIGQTPDAEEAVAFEELWSTIERLLDLSNLSDVIEDELRGLQQIRQTAVHLPPGRYDDLLTLVARKLADLLSRLFDELLPQVEVPVRAAIQLAARGASHADQLIELESSFIVTAEKLQEAAAQTTRQAAGKGEEVEPYLKQQLEWIDNQSQRLKATFQVIDNSRAALVSTATGRAVARIAYSGTAGITGGALVSAGTAVAGISTPGGVPAIAAALLSAVIGNWLYAVRRQSDPALPPRHGAPENSV